MDQIVPRARRERPKVVTLTEAAAARVSEIMARAEKPYAGLRVGVKNGGCAGQEYTLEYAADRQPLDEVIEDKGVTILIEPKAQMYLFGTELDWKEDKLQSGFVFNNPNEKGRCGCGESFHV